MIFLSLYILIGFGEYLRLSEDYRQNLYDDFPYHDKLYLDFSIVLVCLIFSPILLLIKIYMKVKQFFRNVWRKLTFPYRLKKFSKKIDELNKEKDSQKAAEKFFDAMRDVMK